MVGEGGCSGQACTSATAQRWWAFKFEFTVQGWRESFFKFEKLCKLEMNMSEIASNDAKRYCTSIHGCKTN